MAIGEDQPKQPGEPVVIRTACVNRKCLVFIHPKPVLVDRLLLGPGRRMLPKRKYGQIRLNLRFGQTVFRTRIMGAARSSRWAGTSSTQELSWGGRRNCEIKVASTHLSLTLSTRSRPLSVSPVALLCTLHS